MIWSAASGPDVAEAADVAADTWIPVVPDVVAAGLSNDEIADRLVISPATAKMHVSRILLKLGARDRAQLVVMAYESGLIHPGRSQTTR